MSGVQNPLSLTRIMAIYKMIMTNPLGATISNHIDTYPTPLNLTYLWGFGSLAGLALGAQIVSGVLLAMHYAAEVHIAFNSVEHIMRDVVGGWVLRYVHANGASMFFIVVYTHMFRGLYYGSYFQPRANLWYSGVVIFVLMMATAFMGYVLPWGQMSFWGATVITNLFSAIPEIGTSIVQLLWGGFSVDNPTLNRFFSLHYLLPFIIAALAFLHLILLHQPGSNNPLGVSSIYDRVPFYPYFYVKDLFGLCIFIWVFSMFVIYAPNYMGHPDNYIEANPLVTPAHIVPEWYFLPFYAILRTVPDKLGGVVLMFLAIVILAFLPIVDTSAFRSNFFKPLNIWLFWYFFGDSISLGWIGQEIVESPFIEMGVFVTISYFAYFMPSLSFTGFLENKIISSQIRFAGLTAEQRESTVMVVDRYYPFNSSRVTTDIAKPVQEAIHDLSGETTVSYGTDPILEYANWLWNGAAGFFRVNAFEKSALLEPALWRNVPTHFGNQIMDNVFNTSYLLHSKRFHGDHIVTFSLENFYKYQSFNDWVASLFDESLDFKPTADLPLYDTKYEDGVMMLHAARFFEDLTSNFFNLARVNPTIIWEGFIVHLGLVQVVIVALFILFLGFFIEKSAVFTAFLNKLSAYYLVTIAGLYQASIFITPHYTTPYYSILKGVMEAFVEVKQLPFLRGFDYLYWVRDVDFTRTGLESEITNGVSFKWWYRSYNALIEHLNLVNEHNFEILSQGVDMWLYNGYYEMFFILITLLFAIFFYGISDRFFITTSNELEYPILLFFFYIAALLVMLVTNLLEFVLAVEIITLGSYALAAYERKNKFSTYGGVQYFIIGSIPSALLILSLGIIYRAWGTFEYSDIAALSWNHEEAFASYRFQDPIISQTFESFDSLKYQKDHYKLPPILHAFAQFFIDRHKVYQNIPHIHHPELIHPHLSATYGQWYADMIEHYKNHPELELSLRLHEMSAEIAQIEKNIGKFDFTSEDAKLAKGLTPDELTQAKIDIFKAIVDSISTANVKLTQRLMLEIGHVTLRDQKLSAEFAQKMEEALAPTRLGASTYFVGPKIPPLVQMYIERHPESELAKQYTEFLAANKEFLEIFLESTVQETPRGQKLADAYVVQTLPKFAPDLISIEALLDRTKAIQDKLNNIKELDWAALDELLHYLNKHEQLLKYGSQSPNVFISLVLPQGNVASPALGKSILDNVLNNWVYDNASSDSIIFDLGYQYKEATILSFLLLLANFLFKITAAPFQFWAPSVYAKMPTASVTFLSIFTKVLILLAFLKLFIVCFSAYKIIVIWLFIVCGMLSIVFGMAGAFAEKGIKRFFVYSSMGHVGYMTVSLSVSTMPGFEALLHYVTVYVVTSFLMWFILLQMGVKNKNVVQFAGLRIMNRELAGVLAIVVFSMSGIPPLGGFFIKLDVLMAMMDDSRFYTNYLLLFFSVATFFYYLRIIKILFFEEVEGVTSPSFTPEISLVQNGSRISETRQWLIFALFAVITLYSLIVNRALISIETEALNILLND